MIHSIASRHSNFVNPKSKLQMWASHASTSHIFHITSNENQIVIFWVDHSDEKWSRWKVKNHKNHYEILQFCQKNLKGISWIKSNSNEWMTEWMTEWIQLWVSQSVVELKLSSTQLKWNWISNINLNKFNFHKLNLNTHKNDQI